MSKEHRAAFIPKKGAKLAVSSRPTPAPGPTEVLIAVKSIALNPIDNVSLASGLGVDAYPAIIGSDIAGTIVALGSDVPTQSLKLGARVAAFAPAFTKRGVPDYGAFQEYVLVCYEAVVPLPEKISFNEGPLLPMAVQTVFAAFQTIGLPRDAKYSPSDKKGFLVWGAAGSVGSAALQIAQLQGYHVYAAASSKHHPYLSTLGAHRSFDYTDPAVVSAIVRSARADGIALDAGFLATGDIGPSAEVLRQARSAPSVVAKLAVAPLDHDVAKFVLAPENEEERNKFYAFVFEGWLKDRLVGGEFVPSPKVKVVVPGGLEGIQAGLDELGKKVSGVKLVVEL
ncbi:chaperonin 10-like protein [Cladochytrium replicatum]|nr:chaperonin 10-like protein [Cladochytrium replicatum]